MDEATSSVDPSTEKSLLAAATRAFAAKTVITIAVSVDGPRSWKDNNRL